MAGFLVIGPGSQQGPASSFSQNSGLMTDSEELNWDAGITCVEVPAKASLEKPRFNIGKSGGEGLKHTVILVR